MQLSGLWPLISRSSSCCTSGLLLFATVCHPFCPVLLQFEESLISHKMAQLGDESEGEGEEEVGDGQDFLLTDDSKDIDLRCPTCCKPL